MKKSKKNVVVKYLPTFMRGKNIMCKQNEDLTVIDVILRNKNICEEDGKFLKLFVENKKLLSQSDVSKKLGVSQQYISKRFIRIIGKYEIRL